MDTMELENNQIVENFLNRTFFAAWKNKNYSNDPKYCNYASLELQMTPHCDLKCKYCYYARYSKELYPSKISGKKNILKNLEIVLSWLKENDYYPKLEVFSGELFFQELGFKFIERLIEWEIENKRTESIIIPTNYSFLFDDTKTERVEYLIKLAADNGIRLSLSCSVDGKYCDDNRPFVDKKIRDDAYYDKMFKFCKKWNYAFHPMIYSENIEKWKDNWLWFQENMEKHEMSPTAIYLLEVRNVEWNVKQINEYYKFIKFLVKWTRERFKEVPDENFPLFVFDQRVFNLFNLFSSTGRGLGCSMQSTMQLRMGDLTSSICHRAAYKQQNLYQLVVENDKITGVKSLNHNLLIAAASLESRNMPLCDYCTIRELCSSQCIGSMYETNKECFMPIPTVCAVEHAKTAAILDALNELDLTKHFLGYLPDKKLKSIKLYNKYMRGKSNEFRTN